MFPVVCRKGGACLPFTMFEGLNLSKQRGTRVFLLMSAISLAAWLFIALALTGAAQAQPFNLSVKSQPELIFLDVPQPITVTITFAVTPTVGTPQEYIVFYYPPDPESGVLWDEESNDTASGVEQEEGATRPRTRRYWEIAPTSTSFANVITVYLTSTEAAQPGIVTHEVRLLEVGSGRNTVAVAQTELRLLPLPSPTPELTQTITVTLTVSATVPVTIPTATATPLLLPPTWTIPPEQPSLIAPTVTSTATPVISSAVSLALEDNTLPTLQATLPLAVADGTASASKTIPLWLIAVPIGGLFLLGLILLFFYATRSQHRLKSQIPGSAFTIRAGASATVSSGVESRQRVCPDCQSKNAPGERFCAVCGRVLIPATSPSAPETLTPTLRSETSNISVEGAIPHVPNLDLHVGQQTNIGMLRQINEDSLLVLEATWNNRGRNQPVCLLAVADGMGGHEGGEVASGLIVQTLARAAFQSLLPVASGLTGQPLEPTHWLQQTVQTANQTIWQQRSQAENDMGSTLVVAVVVGNTATIAHVGDSRAYHINQEGIHQLTTDHSLVERLVATHQITREQARQHPQSNVIYRTVGDKEQVDVDTTVFSIPPGDYLLLCSDGLTGMIPDEEIWQIVRDASSPQAACWQLIQAANANGGEDNISVILVKPELL